MPGPCRAHRYQSLLVLIRGALEFPHLRLRQHLSLHVRTGLLPLVLHTLLQAIVYAEELCPVGDLRLGDEHGLDQPCREPRALLVGKSLVHYFRLAHFDPISPCGTYRRGGRLPLATRSVRSLSTSHLR